MESRSRRAFRLYCIRCWSSFVWLSLLWPADMRRASGDELVPLSRPFPPPPSTTRPPPDLSMPPSPSPSTAPTANSLEPQNELQHQHKSTGESSLSSTYSHSTQPSSSLPSQSWTDSGQTANSTVTVEHWNDASSIKPASSTHPGPRYLGCWSWLPLWQPAGTGWNATSTASSVTGNSSTDGNLNETLAITYCALTAQKIEAQYIALDNNGTCFYGRNDTDLVTALTDLRPTNFSVNSQECMNVYDFSEGHQYLACWLFALDFGVDDLAKYLEALPDDVRLSLALEDACALVARTRGYLAFITQFDTSCYGATDALSLTKSLTGYLNSCTDSAAALKVYIISKEPINNDTEWSSWTSCSRGCGAGNTTRLRYRIQDNHALPEVEDAVCNVRLCPWTNDAPKWAGCWSSIPGALQSLEQEMLSPADRNAATRQAAVEKCAVLSYGLYPAFAVKGGRCYAINISDVSPLYRNDAPSDGCATYKYGASTGLDVYAFSPEPPPGSWSIWSPFDSCTAACGGGQYARKRMCRNPPSHDGCPPGAPQEKDVQTCNNRPCPLNFGWAVRIGCYKVPASYIELNNPLLDGLSLSERKDPFKKCALVAFIMNYTVFGFASDQMCWTGPMFYCQLNQTDIEMTNCSTPMSSRVMEVYRFKNGPAAATSSGKGISESSGLGAAVTCPSFTSTSLSPASSSSSPSTTTTTLVTPSSAAEDQTVVTSTLPSTPSGQQSTVDSAAFSTADGQQTTTVPPVADLSSGSSALRAINETFYTPTTFDEFGLSQRALFDEAVAALGAAEPLADRLSAAGGNGKTITDFMSSLKSKLVLGNASEATRFLSSFSETLNSFTSSSMATVWMRAPRYGGLMLQAAEEIALYCASLVDNMTVSSGNTALQVASLQANRNSSAVFAFNSMSSSFPSVTIPPEIIQVTVESRITIAAIEYKNFSSTLHSSDVPANNNLMNGTLLPSVLSLRTNIIESGAVLAAPVVITMRYNSTTADAKSKVNATCVFWNVTSEAWSFDGCVSVDINSTIECRCNHLTSFAVLMRIENYEPEGDTATALTYISYIGCGISVACLITTFGVLLYLNNLKSDKKIIHMNLVVSLGVAQVTHIAGINLTSDSITCTVIAAMLHFFYTAAFFWMLCEGVHLYLKVVAVFNSENASKRIVYYIIGYVCPLVIVGVSLAIRHDGYGNTSFCWLSINDGLIWAFVGPVCAIILCNIIILSMVMKIVISTAATIPNKKKKDLQLVRTGIKGVMILMPLLGVSWLFGLLAVNNSMLVFEFLFVIINSTQGLFIFLFHCVGSSEVRSAFRRKRDQTSRSKDGKRSSVAQSTNEANPNNNQSAKDGIAILVEDPRFPVLYLNNFQADGQKVPLTIESAIDGLLNGTLGLNVGGLKHALPADVDVVDTEFSKSALNLADGLDDEAEIDDIDDDAASAELADVSQDDMVGGCLQTVDRATKLGSREQTRLDLSNCERRSALSTGQLREASTKTRLSTARRVTSAREGRPATRVSSATTTPVTKADVALAQRTVSIQTSSGIGSTTSLNSCWEEELNQSLNAERPRTAAVQRPRSLEHQHARLGSASARLASSSGGRRPSSDGSSCFAEQTPASAATVLQLAQSDVAANDRRTPIRLSSATPSSTLRNRSGRRSAKVSPSPLPHEISTVSSATPDEQAISHHPFRLVSVSDSPNFIYTK